MIFNDFDDKHMDTFLVETTLMSKSSTSLFQQQVKEKINMMNIRFGDLFRSLMTDTLE